MKKTNRKAKWEKPVVVEIVSLPDVFGSCWVGETDPGLNCENGSQTNQVNLNSHQCHTGGIAHGGCSIGDSPD